MRPDFRNLGWQRVVSTSRAKGFGKGQFTPTVNPMVKGGVNGGVNPIDWENRFAIIPG
jgi:hypothetical protein